MMNVDPILRPKEVAADLRCSKGEGVSFQQEFATTSEFYKCMPESFLSMQTRELGF